MRDSGKRKNSWRDTRFDRYSTGGIRRNLGTGWGIGKRSGIRGRDFRGSGCVIVVKKVREYGIRDPLPLSDPKVNVPLIKWYVSGKLPTYPSPKPTFCPKWEVSVNVCLGRGRWAVSQKRIMLQQNPPCEQSLLLPFLARRRKGGSPWIQSSRSPNFWTDYTILFSLLKLVSKCKQPFTSW